MTNLINVVAETQQLATNEIVADNPDDVSGELRQILSNYLSWWTEVAWEEQATGEATEESLEGLALTEAALRDSVEDLIVLGGFLSWKGGYLYLSL